MRELPESGLYSKARDWLASTDPIRMLHSLPTHTTSQRKLRLVGCAGFRLIWDLLIHEELRNAVEVAERLADAIPSGDEFKSAWETAWGADTPEQIAFEYAAAGIVPADLLVQDAYAGACRAARCPR